MKFRKMLMITLYAKQKKRHRCIGRPFVGVKNGVTILLFVFPFLPSFHPSPSLSPPSLLSFSPFLFSLPPFFLSSSLPLLPPFLLSCLSEDLSFASVCGRPAMCQELPWCWLVMMTRACPHEVDNLVAESDF